MQKQALGIFYLGILGDWGAGMCQLDPNRDKTKQKKPWNVPVRPESGQNEAKIALECLGQHKTPPTLSVVKTKNYHFPHAICYI